MKEHKDPCSICENWAKDITCDNNSCPVAEMKAENQKLKKKIERLKHEMSYMQSPNVIGESYEMGAW